MNLFRFIIFFLSVITNFSVKAQGGPGTDYLYVNQILSNNQRLVTPNGKFQLIMQSDGNLVMYRPDGTVRFRGGSNGVYAGMQPNGNFVEIGKDGMGVFQTGTSGINNFLHIQEDGNLVVYTAAAVPLWSLGGDPTASDPKDIGDVVGRDLAFTGAGYLGHLGIYDGSQIVQVGPPVSGNNAVHYESLDNFKNTKTNTGSIAEYWGVARAPIADGDIWGCYKTYCESTSDFIITKARVSVAKRAYQIYLIGSDYTSTAIVTPASWATARVPAKRGSYRCDTFVVSVLSPSANYETTATILTQAQQTWKSRIYALVAGMQLPATTFNTIKNYK